MKISHNPSRRPGFTLVELLVAMTVIGILVGMLAFGVNRVLTRSREFTIQMEMNQLESAIEQFRTKFGFYPPSFREMEDLHFVNGEPELAANLMLTYLNRIAPNHMEGSGIYPDRPVDFWWENVGSKRTELEASGLAGSDLAFWLSGLAKNKQRPLTQGPIDNLVANAAHNKALDNIERHVFYEFDDAQSTLLGNGEWIQYNQPVGREIPYLYLDRNNYLPSRRHLENGDRPYDGAYCNNLADVDYDTVLLNTDVNFRQSFIGSNAFKQLFPNPDSYQLITFGIDSQPGVTEPYNIFTQAGPQGADNMVNFGNSGPIKLEALILEAQ